MGISINMPRLSRDQRQYALGILQGGLSYREVARRLGCSHQTISALVDRDTLHNSADDRPRSGRPRVTTARQDRQMVLSHLWDELGRRRARARTRAELLQTLRTEWDRIQQQSIQRLVDYAPTMHCLYPKQWWPHTLLKGD